MLGTIISFSIAFCINQFIPQIYYNELHDTELELLERKNYKRKGFPSDYTDSDFSTNRDTNYRIRIFYIQLIVLVSNSISYITVVPDPTSGFIFKQVPEVSKKISLSRPLPSLKKIEDISGESYRSKFREFLDVSPNFHNNSGFTSLNTDQLRKIDYLGFQVIAGNIELNDAILQLRGGDWGPLIEIALFLAYLKWLHKIGAFGNQNPNPHPTPTMASNPTDDNTQGFVSQNKPYYRALSPEIEETGPKQIQASSFVKRDGSVDLRAAYKEVLRRARFNPRFKFQCPFERFVDLATEAGEVTTVSVRATISALQMESDGIVSNVRRDPFAVLTGRKGLNFLCDGPRGETHLEIKGPVGSEIRRASVNRPSITRQGRSIGSALISQLDYWFAQDPDTAKVTIPAKREDVFVGIDLFDVLPNVEKGLMID